MVITDNAKYHHAKMHQAWREARAPDFILDNLPPYSPELNPIERVWNLTRRLCLHDQYFPTLDGVIAAWKKNSADGHWDQIPSRDYVPYPEWPKYLHLFMTARFRMHFEL